MKNKKQILNYIYNNILVIENTKINIYIEEISESQFEYYYKNKSITKTNKLKGVNIIIKKLNQEYFEKFSFNNYLELPNKVFDVLKKYVCLNNLKRNYPNKKFKYEKKKVLNLTRSKKIRICKYITKKLKNIDGFKLSFYEKKENIFILNNEKKSILNINNFFAKIMLKSFYKKIESFDHLLFTNGYFGLNKRQLDEFVENHDFNNFIKYSSKSLVDGVYNLILSNKCGTIFHEMFGHNLEYDLIKKLSNKVFEKSSFIGNDLITYVDNPEICNLLCIKYNCYGNRRNKKILIKNGVVTDFLTDDSKRSENYKFFPLSRMSNSYLKPINNTKPLNINDIDRIIYIKKIKNGRLFLEEQKFKIEIDCAFLMEKGKIKSYISDLSFVVDINSFLKNIKYVGNDLDFIPSVCGAESGNIFVFAGCPTVFVKDIHVIQDK